jgi:predicted metal-dependent peptidase
LGYVSLTSNDPKIVKDIQQEISRCINQMLIKEPFYAHLLSGVVRIYTDEIPTAAVGIKDNYIALFINADFFLKELTTFSERVAVVKHETLHLLFRHIFRDSKLKDHELLNIAADLVVNQYIGSWDLPKFAITLATFPDLKLREKQTMEYYYSELDKLRKKGGEDSPISFQALNSVIGEPTNGDHSKWVTNGELDNIINEILGQKILDALKRTPTRLHGTMPGDLIDYIKSLEKVKPSVDWKRLLRIFASTNGRSYVAHTMKRISKRYGTRPGIKIKRLWKIAVVIDTSGSIDQVTLQLFINEINHIHRCGADITLIQCDAVVQEVVTYKPSMTVTVKGGGGTNFDPVLELIKKSKNNYSGVIYFTDGYAPSPTIKIKQSLIWVITPDGKTGDHLIYGKQVQIKAT